MKVQKNNMIDGSEVSWVVGGREVATVVTGGKEVGTVVTGGKEVCLPQSCKLWC